MKVIDTIKAIKFEEFALDNIFVIIFSALLCGLLATILPPLAFVFIIPFIALIYSEKISKLKMYIWGVFWYIGTIWWMAIVPLSDMQPLIFFASFGLAFFLALRFLVVGILSAFVLKRSPKLAPVFVGAIWVVSEYILAHGELSFPWMFVGYSLSPVPFLSQIVSVTGIWGLSFLASIAATTLYLTFFAKQEYKLSSKFAYALVAVVAIISLWGFIRMRPTTFHLSPAVVIQPNFDMENWLGLGEALEVIDSMLLTTKDWGFESRPIFVLPESALWTHLKNSTMAQISIGSWTRRHNSHIILGSLTPIMDDYDFSVIGAYNTAYWINPALSNRYENYSAYHKIYLVPFVETTPLQGILPMVSRMDIRGGGFSSGVEYTVWEIDDLRIAPFICYENVYPDFTRRRINVGANLIVNLTNDGWFGATTAPFQHAEMTRVRAIETGTPIIRSANTGVSFSIDPFGRVLSSTDIYTREIVKMPIAKALDNTIYRKFGDWFAALAVLFSLFAVGFSIARRR